MFVLSLTLKEWALIINPSITGVLFPLGMLPVHTKHSSAPYLTNSLHKYITLSVPVCTQVTSHAWQYMTLQLKYMSPTFILVFFLVKIQAEKNL